MGKERIVARALARQERAQVKAAIKAGDELGYNRNYTRGLVKFGQEGMTPEARLARAREMGFDTDTTMYHGTPQGDIPSFEYGRDRDGVLLNQEQTATQSGRGVSLAFSPEHAAGYATPDHWSILTPQQGRWLAARFLPNNDYEGYQRAQAALIANRLERFSPTVMPVMTVKDRANVTMPKGYAWNTDEGALMDQGLAKARKSGKRAATVRNVTEGDQVAVFDRSAIRSPNATFDPARANRRDLLAGVVPVAAAGGAGALAMQPQEAEAARLPIKLERMADRGSIKAQDMLYAAQRAENAAYAFPDKVRSALPGVDGNGMELAGGRGWMDIQPADFGGKKEVSFVTNADPTNRRAATDIFASARERLREDMDSRPWWEPSSGYKFYPMTPKHERIYDRFVQSFDHPDYKAVKKGSTYELQRKFPLRHEVAAAATIGAPAAVLWPQDAEGGVSSPALGVPAVPGVPDSVGAPPASALARALAREASTLERQVRERREANDGTLTSRVKQVGGLAGEFLDPTLFGVGAYNELRDEGKSRTEALLGTPARAVEDFRGEGGAFIGTLPLQGLGMGLGAIGQAPKATVAGGRALARALARKPQPRGSQTYRKAK